MAVPVPVITVTEASWLQPKRDAGYNMYPLPTASYAPFAVFFEGWASTPHAKAATYTWSPGDGTTPTIGGFCFAHVYETPGVYTATLTITDGADEASATIVITVLNPNGFTYYVDATAGLDTNDGTSPETAWKTFGKVFSYLSATGFNKGDRILFKRGETFTTAGVSVGHWKAKNGGFQFGAYGSGAKPIIKYSGTADGDNYILNAVGQGFCYISFSDIEFDGVSSDGHHANTINSISVDNSLLFLRCDFKNHRTAFGNNPYGAFFFNCTFADSSNNTHLYYYGHRLAVVNCTLTNSANHGAYIESCHGGYFRGNTWDTCIKGRHLLRISRGSNVYITDTDFLTFQSTSTDAHWCVVHFAPNGPDPKSLDNLLFEYNTISGGDCQLNIGSQKNVVVRYNLFEKCQSVDRLGQILIGSIHGFDNYACENIEIYGNIAELGDTFGTGHRNAFVFVRDELCLISTLRTGVPRAVHSNIQIHNNLVALDSDEMMLACNWAEQRAVTEYSANTIYRSTANNIASFANLNNYTELKSFAEFAAQYEGANTANVLITTAYTRPDDFLPDPPTYDEDPEVPEDPDPEDPPPDPPTEEEMGDWVYFYGWVAPTGQEAISVDSFIPCQGWIQMTYLDRRTKQKFESRPRPRFKAVPKPEFEAN